MKFYLEVYGCTTNQGDAASMTGILEDAGHSRVATMDDAVLLILVTCTIVATTEQRMLHRLRVFGETGKRVIVAGCMASAQADLLERALPDAEILEPIHLHHIAEMAEGNLTGCEYMHKTGFRRLSEGGVVAIPIAEGCPFSCAYCITKLARGKLVSYPREEIVRDVCRAVHEGCHEIRLTAQDTAAYGLDSGDTLGNLIRDIAVLPGDFMVRVGMMNPTLAKKELDDILDAYDHPKVYKFLHLPVQSGDDEVLRSMRRGHTAGDFEEVAAAFRKRFGDVVISTDAIVGFPGETEEQFWHTAELLERARPDITNITRFSARPGTAAKAMRPRVQTNVMKSRSRALSKLTARIQLECNLLHAGAEYDIVVTEKGKAETMMGRTKSYRPVVYAGEDPIGIWKRVRITGATEIYLVGERI